MKEKPELRHMSKFSMCNNCIRSPNNGPEAPAQDFSNLMSVKSSGQIYCLKTEDIEESIEEDNDLSQCAEAIGANEDEQDSQPIVQMNKKTIMFPTNTGCIIPGNDHIKDKVPSLVPVIVNKCEEVTLNDVGVLYCNQISKYRNVLNFSTRFFGTLETLKTGL